jgi:hypothetical protein
MTPKMRGALDSLKQLKSYADDEADKLVRRIHDQSMPALNAAFKTAHGTVDGMHSIVDEIDGFAKELMNHNGGDPLPDSSTASDPRSSEVAKK